MWAHVIRNSLQVNGKGLAAIGEKSQRMFMDVSEECELDQPLKLR